MAPHTLRWGIISTGMISTQFSKDLMIDPSTRNASDVVHKITAIGSRTVDSAEAFVAKLKSAGESGPEKWGLENGTLDGVKAYGTYEEVYNDPDVDVIYVGTPHNFHHKNSKDAMLAGKHVLCEKPFTLDLAELDDLIKTAKETNKFLMEAVWTRFHPIAYEVQEIIHSNKLGRIKRFSADFSMDAKVDSLPDSSRMIDPKLLGGALLDMGPYPSVWAMLVLFQHPDNKGVAPKLVNSHQTIYKRTGVDISSKWLLEFEGLNSVEASLVTDLSTKGLADNTCAIQCEEGDLIIESPPYRPTVYNIVPHANPPKGPDFRGAIKERSRHETAVGIPGAFMHFEADHVARCLRDGKIESERMPWEESRIVQGWFDKVRTEGPTVLKDLKSDF